MFSIFISDRPDGAVAQQQDFSVRVSHKDGRVGGDKQLRILFHQPVDFGKQGQLPGRGERGLRFIQKIEAISLKAVEHQGQETFSMGLLVQRLPAKILQVAFVRTAAIEVVF